MTASDPRPPAQGPRRTTALPSSSAPAGAQYQTRCAQPAPVRRRFARLGECVVEGRAQVAQVGGRARRARSSWSGPNQAARDCSAGRDEVVEVSVAHQLGLAAFGEPLGAVLADGLQHPEADPAVGLGDRQHRLVRPARPGPRSRGAGLAAHRLDRLDLRAAVEDRHPGPECLFGRRAQVVAPVHSPRRVWCRGSAVREPVVSRSKRSSRRSTICPRESTRSRGAASSIARGCRRAGGTGG